MGRFSGMAISSSPGLKNRCYLTKILMRAIIEQTCQIEAQNCLVNSYRNIISKWAVIFRYENFFIPRVEKFSKISPWEKKILHPAGLRPLGGQDFSPLG